MTLLSFDPVVAALLALAALLYLRAVRILTTRGRRVPAGQQALWWSGMALLAIGLLGPPDAYDKRLLSAHMAQHLLIGDVAAPLLLAGMRWPVLYFYLPRPLLTLLARRRWLRVAFRFLRRPLIALPVYVVITYVWHLDVLFTGALRHPALHALQHECFIAANLLLWWPVVEPKRRRMPGELWKLGYIFGARMSTMFLGMVFVFARGTIYSGFYGHGSREGLSALADQQTAGGLMMTLDILILAFAVCFFFWRFSLAHSDDAEEQLAPTGAPGALSRP